MGFSTTAKNTMLTEISGDCLYASLHSSDPENTGANEISGGSYARKSVSWDTPSGGSAALSADVTFDVPASTTVAYVGYWDAATSGNWQGSDQVTSETFNDAGQYKLTASGTSLTIND